MDHIFDLNFYAFSSYALNTVIDRLQPPGGIRTLVTDMSLNGNGRNVMGFVQGTRQ